MATIKFGTDGVRGRAFEDLSMADAFLMGRAAADVFGGTEAVVGRDTRESGPALTAALAAGLAAGGIDTLLGVLDFCGDNETFTAEVISLIFHFII